MPYMGLCGLVCVSFCDIAAITVPLVFAIAAVDAIDLMPRRMAPSECQASPREVSMKLPVELPARSPDQRFRTVEIGAAGQVKDDEGNLAGAVGGNAAGRLQTRDVSNES